MSPFNEMEFRHSWRPYQKRVLDAVHQHLNDKRLHIVAAPGAGKTTLGLEVFRLLGKPAIVLSPTRVIRDQWLDRLKDFCQLDDINKLNWVSNTLLTPKTLTSITYQALHSQFAEELNQQDTTQDTDEAEELELDSGLKDAELNNFISILEQHNIQVLILDEAHHLRAEWWRALEKVCSHFPNITLVSLTATPPYDSERNEWSRYEQLCGPIDEEISIPELVKAGTLCPHQDYIWACNATVEFSKQIKEYDQRVSSTCKTLFANAEFEQVVLAHPWLNSNNIDDWVIKEPKIAIALLSFIKAKALPPNKPLMQLLDLTQQDIPELGKKWWQTLVEAVLFSKTFEHSESSKIFIDALKKQLRAAELLYKTELSFERSRRMERSLSLSATKIDACLEIHKLEYSKRGDGLRQVILTDYIRDEALASGMDTGAPNLGAWPIFKTLTSSSPIADQIALLTGRLCIVPTSKLDALLNHLGSGNFKTEPMGNKQQYQKVTGPLNRLTGAFTALLIEGEIKVLVGTRALLGEGWDAPVVNSLILASSIGSFMLTNQMRGRAIRIDRQYNDKVSSIWHLVAIDPDSFGGWSDYHNLKKRFDTFVGLSEKKQTIESGFERMHATAIESDFKLTNNTPIALNNFQMRNRYNEIHSIAKRWQKALTLNANARVIPSVKTEKSPRIRGYMLRYSLKYLVTQLIGLMVITGVYSVYAAPMARGLFPYFILAAVTGVLLYKLPKTIAVIKILIRYLPTDGALKQIGIALTEALSRAGFIETPFRELDVRVTTIEDGSYYLSLAGSTFYESSLFADCLAEILAPIDNPRYIVLREGTFMGMRRDDYHAVPVIFTTKKETATIFYKAWCKNVSLSELIYTRSTDGRKRLLKAKMKAFSSTFNNDVKRQDRWQ